MRTGVHVCGGNGANAGRTRNFFDDVHWILNSACVSEQRLRILSVCRTRSTGANAIVRGSSCSYSSSIIVVVVVVVQMEETCSCRFDLEALSTPSQ